MKHDMMKKLMQKGKSLSPVEKTAKMSVLNQLKQDMNDSMKDKLHGMKKSVTVSSDNDEDLSHGLDTAKELLSKHTGHDGHDKDVESAEESLGEDLDHDDEAGESEEHKDMVFRAKPNEGHPTHKSMDMSPEAVEKHASKLNEEHNSYYAGGEVGDFKPEEGDFDPYEEMDEGSLDELISSLMDKKAKFKSK